MIRRLRRWLADQADMRRCVCGHPRNAHTHYRQGTDCALCKCPKWRAK